MEDNYLIEKLKKGEISAREAFVRKYQELIFNAIFQVARDMDLSKDVLEETFLRAFKYIASFKKEANISTWLYRIAMNVLNDELKRMNKVRPLGNDVSTLEPQEYAFDDKKHIIFEGMKTLDKEDREAITSVDIHGMTYEQAAAFLDIPIGTVRSRLARAREKLRDAILKSNFFDRI